MKQNKSKFSLKWKLFLFMLLFIIFVIFILWLFQIFLLDNFYREIKLTKIRNLSDTITERISKYDSVHSTINLENEFQNVAINNEANIYLIIRNDDNTLDIISSISNTSFDALQPESSLIDKMWTNAKQQGLSEFMVDTSKVSQYSYQNPNTIAFHNSDAIVYGKFFKTLDNAEILLILSTQLIPVEVVTETLEIQLLFIVIILLLFGICVAFIMARFISEPLAKLTTSAKALPNGKFDAKFNAGGYLEVEELSRTLTYATKELKKSESLQRDLVANVSHELRTPLTLIAGYSEMMRDLPGEATIDNFNIIIDETKRLSMLVNDVLALSRLQSGVHEFEITVFNISLLIEEVLNRFNLINDIKIVYEKSSNDIYIKGDENQIKQVVYNFIANAINYSKDNEKNKLIKIKEKIENNYITISIIDNGIGIKKENLENIWVRYYKVYDKQKKKAIGSGLGLSIVKEILDNHHFEYGASSEYMVGSEFWFKMPIEKIEVDENE